MKGRNVYPVEFKKFLRIKSNGQGEVLYAILDDRIHMEFVIENCVYATQKFLVNIKEELEQKADNYTGDPIDIFLKMYISNTTFYRFYPTDADKKELKQIKLYDKIIVTQTKPGEYNADALKIIESDTYMKAVDGDEVVIFGEKR